MQIVLDEGAADGRVTLIGDVSRVSKEEVASEGLAALYKEKHPKAFCAETRPRSAPTSGALPAAAGIA